MRTVFFGTPEFAVPCLERLLAGNHPVVAVVSQPDRPRGRGRKTRPSPVAQAARQAGVPLLQPESVTDPLFQETLRGFRPDIGVVAAFGQFLPRAVRELPRRGYLVNAHASLLPRYRGAAPIVRAMLEGESRTGISVMRIVKEMDAGPIGLQRELEIRDRENAGELEERLAQLAADLIDEALEAISLGHAEWIEQDTRDATTAPKLTREDTQIDWETDAPGLVRRIRAMAPRPGAATRFQGEILRILDAQVEDSTAPARRPGSVVRTQSPSSPVHIATGEGWLAPLQLQRAGGRVLPVDVFLRGNDIPDGSQLDDTDPVS